MAHTTANPIPGLLSALIASVDASAPQSARFDLAKRLAAASTGSSSSAQLDDVGRAISAQAGPRGSDLFRALSSRAAGANVARLLLSLSPVPDYPRSSHARQKRENGAKQCMYALQGGLDVAQGPNAQALAPLVATGQQARGVRALATRLAGQPELGQCSQRFGHAVLSELDEFDRFVADLEHEALRADWASPPAKLAAWARPAGRRVSDLWMLLRSCEGMRGGMLVCNVWRFARHGSPRTSALARRVALQIWQPLRDVCVEWCTRGVLADRHEEFFVSGQGAVAPGNLFVHAELAGKVAAAGRAMQLAKRATRDAAELDLGVARAVAELVREPDVAPEEFVRRLVLVTAPPAHALVMTALRSTHRLHAHLLALKHLLLHAQGAPARRGGEGTHRARAASPPRGQGTFSATSWTDWAGPSTSTWRRCRAPTSPATLSMLCRRPTPSSFRATSWPGSTWRSNRSAWTCSRAGTRCASCTTPTRPWTRCWTWKP
jgi:hypothetical protein